MCQYGTLIEAPKCLKQRTFTMSEAAPKSGEYLDGKLWFTRKAAIVTIGLTSAAIEEIGAVQKIEMPEEGDDFTKGEVVVTVTGSNSEIEVIAPASGMVHEVNSEIKEETDRVTEDPLEEGWLVKLEVEDPTELKEFA
ncbi:MAG TPA: hypothetical protein DCS07_12740 [Bdellovibrionales bacterium]|nr:hypothetical protein [Bdellovibrionales bacterium]HCM40451.1 hypothetical protein [Bdellovibrionales bacterium]